MALESIPIGAIRYNTDSNKMECFNGTKWMQVAVSESAPIGGRGLWGGGELPSSFQNVIEYITIATQGNAVDFGDLTGARSSYGCFASRTRGVFGSGKNPSHDNTFDYVTIATQGNAIDFGDMVGDTDLSLYQCKGCVGSDTRGIVTGSNTKHNNISYFTISSTGNAQDFGDMITGIEGGFGLSSATRAIFGANAPSATNVMEYVTIASTGNSVDYGDLPTARVEPGGGDTSTRGFIMGSYGSPAYLNTIEYCTIATLGNAQDWGDLSQKVLSGGVVSSPTRICFNGATYPSSTYDDFPMIEIINPVHKGNAQDFGDLNNPAAFRGGLSNVHGGL